MLEARAAFQAQDVPATVVALPRFAAIDGALRAIRPIVAELGALTGAGPGSFEAVIASWRERAASFWEAQRRIAPR
jgi:hypothetical protein